MRKLFFFPILFLLSALIVNASCDSINMDVIEVQKNESCYTFFSAVFEDRGCESNCFSNADRFIVKQGEKILRNITGITTTFYGISIKSPDCKEKSITMQLIEKDGNICTKTFNLDTELVAWNEYNNIVQNQTSVKETQSVTASQTINETKTENQKRVVKTSVPESVAASNQETIETVNTGAISNIDVTKNETTNEWKKTEDSNSTLKLIAASIIILIIVLVVVSFAFFIPKKKKTTKKKSKR